jgi:hypothetical protein
MEVAAVRRLDASRDQDVRRAHKMFSREVDGRQGGRQEERVIAGDCAWDLSAMMYHEVTRRGVPRNEGLCCPREP